MSDTDPYAGPEETTVHPAAKVVAPVAEESAKAVEKPAEDVPDGTAKEVLDWVDNDPKKAALALKAETDGKNRSSLVKHLKEIV